MPTLPPFDTLLGHSLRFWETRCLVTEGRVTVLLCGAVERCGALSASARLVVLWRFTTSQWKCSRAKGPVDSVEESLILLFFALELHEQRLS